MKQKNTDKAVLTSKCNAIGANFAPATFSWIYVFCLRDEAEILNITQSLLKLPYHR